VPSRDRATVLEPEETDELDPDELDTDELDTDELDELTVPETLDEPIVGEVEPPPPPHAVSISTQTIGASDVARLD
jgi:hypothetical protein